MTDLKGKTIAVTGGAGFLGTRVVERFRDRGASVFVPRSCYYDLRDVTAIRRMLDDVKPEIVVHLAAKVGGIGANRANPGSFFYDNLMMGVQLLHESYKLGVEKFVGLGTICSYPKFTAVPFNEYAIWDGYPEETNAPYGLAKKMLLVQAQAYRQQYGFNAVTLFPVNLYGPGDNFDLETSHVIPAMIRKFLDARDHDRGSVTLWGDGTPTREFLYVDDCAEAIALATERFDGPEPVNIGTGEEISMSDLAEEVAYACGYTCIVQWDTSKPNGQPRRCLDTSRARNLFGFEAGTSLCDGLKKTIDWYETVMLQRTSEQVAREAAIRSLEY